MSGLLGIDIVGKRRVEMSLWLESQLRLVAQALLVAILLHALLALVLIDFRFTAFLNGAHGCCWF